MLMCMGSLVTHSAGMPVSPMGRSGLCRPWGLPGCVGNAALEPTTLTPCNLASPMGVIGQNVLIHSRHIRTV